MPARSATPGLIVIKRRNGFDLYWSAKSLARDIEGFPDPLLRVPKGSDEDQIIDFCERMTTTGITLPHDQDRPRVESLKISAPPSTITLPTNCSPRRSTSNCPTSRRRANAG
jgi:hypothetical protein